MQAEGLGLERYKWLMTPVRVKKKKKGERKAKGHE